MCDIHILHDFLWRRCTTCHHISSIRNSHIIIRAIEFFMWCVWNLFLWLWPNLFVVKCSKKRCKHNVISQPNSEIQLVSSSTFWFHVSWVYAAVILFLKSSNTDVLLENNGPIRDSSNYVKLSLDQSSRYMPIRQHLVKSEISTPILNKVLTVWQVFFSREWKTRVWLVSSFLSITLPQNGHHVHCLDSILVEYLLFFVCETFLCWIYFIFKHRLYKDLCRSFSKPG